MLTAALAGRRRFWGFALFILTLNAALWAGYDRFYTWRHRGELRVDTFEPGEGATIGPRDVLRWRFSADVIPTSNWGKDPGTIAPAVAGHWGWDDPRTLCFTPDADYPRASIVTASLNRDFLRSASGATLGAAFTGHVNCAPLEVTDAHQVSVQPDDQYVIQVSFTDPVSPADVMEHLSAKDARGKVVKCEPYGKATGQTICIETEQETGNDSDKLWLDLSPGLVGSAGPLGLAAAREFEVDLQHGLSPVQLSADSPVKQSPSLTLEFNDGVSLDALKDVLSVDPSVAYTLEQPSPQTVELRGDFKPATRYTVTIAAPPPGCDPAVYPRPGHLSAFVPDRQAGVWFDGDGGYLSSDGGRKVVGHAVNVRHLHVSVMRMYDNNLVTWRNGDNGGNTEPFSSPLVDKSIELPVKKNEVQDISLSLDDLLPASAPRDGVYQVSVESRDPDVESRYDDFDDESRARCVATLSDIGLTGKRTHDGMVVWAASLRTAEPLSGVRVRVYSNKNQKLGEAITDADGLARIADIHPGKGEDASVVLADRVQQPSDMMGPMLPATEPSNAGAGESTGLTWLDMRAGAMDMGDADVRGRDYLHEGYEAFVYTDRGVYRPGETVHLRALVRGRDGVLPEDAFPVRWRLRRPGGRAWMSQTVMLDTDGSAAWDVTIPPEMPTGEWTAQIGLPGDESDLGSATFQVEEFVPNRMKVGLTFDGAARLTAREAVQAKVAADYLIGRPAGGLDVELFAHAEPVNFAPTGWNSWTFGDQGRMRAEPPKRATAEPMHKVLDAQGRLDWTLDLPGLLDITDHADYRGPWQLTASAGVCEAGGRAVTAVREAQVDLPGSYIGIKQSGVIPALPGNACNVQISRVQPDGSRDVSDGSLEAELDRVTYNVTWTVRHGQYEYNTARVLQRVSGATVPLSEGQGAWSPVIPDSGDWVVSLHDAKSGAFTSMLISATDGTEWDDFGGRENPQHVEVRVLGAGQDPDAALKSPGKSGPMFHMGDTARVLIASPFAGRLLLTVESDDVIQTRVMEMTAAHMVVEVPVTDACRPNAYVSATVIRGVDATSSAAWAPHRAFGVARLSVDPGDRRLKIALSSPAELRPLHSLDVNVLVTNPDGTPATHAAVTLAAVDEGICSLTNFSTPDSLAFYQGNRALGVRSADVYGLLMPEAKETGGDAGEKPARHITPVVARRIKPVALAWVTVHTDADGLARGSFSLPEFEGKLRIMAVGYSQNLFGTAESPVIVRSPVTIQSTWPRFAAPGDRFSVPIVLFNNTPVAGHAVVTTDAQGGTLLQFPHSVETDLAPGGQAQVDLPVVVAMQAGVAHVTVRISMNGQGSEEQIELPIRPAAPSMEFGGYLTASTTRPTTVTPAAKMLDGTESMEVHVTAWPTLQLPSALDYLNRYPYGCVEQTTSACFPLLALGKIGKQIDPKEFDENLTRQNINYGIERLVGMQTGDGGLSMWPGETDDWEWGTVYAAHFLTAAKTAGYPVPDEFYGHVMGYVRRLLERGTDEPDGLELQSYAAYVLALSGKPDRAILDRLTELTGNPRQTLYGDTRMFLSCAWLLSGRRDLAESMIPETLPLPRTARQCDGNIGSPIRDRAILIYTLATVEPNHPSLPELTQELSDTALRDGWAGTQDAAFAALAIGKYLEVARHSTPLKGATIEQAGKILAQSEHGAPLAFTETNELPLRVNISGKPDALGYVTWMQSGTPMLPPPNAEHGISIHRTYEHLDGSPLTDNTAEIGELVRVRLVIDAPPGQKNLVLEDLLPAGLEIENQRLKTSAKDESDKASEGRFMDDHDDVRDDRMVFMGDMPGRSEAWIEYLARAVTPGTYTQPPVRAEAMYDISTSAIWGAGGTFKVVRPAAGGMASSHD